MKRIVQIGLIGLIMLIGPKEKLWAQNLPLSETATASVLTCGSGNDFYTTFGHSALRICDPATGLDIVYNYGTFNFNTPHFYWKFTRGRLDYMLGRSSFESFMYEYQEEGRAVWEQRLALTSQEVNNLFLLLEQNYLPEYRHYRYDFFRDNCATRVRDMVNSSLVHRDTLMLRKANPISYRQLIAMPLKHNLEWWRLGIDMLFGLPADHRCTSVERMFLPIEMMAEYKSINVRSDGVCLELFFPPIQLLDETREPLSRSIPPVAVFSLLFGAVAILTWRNLMPRWADIVLFVFAGVVGLFLLFMWFGTDHYCTAWNLNILWASPLLLLIAIRLERSPRWALWLQEACFMAAAVWVLWCHLIPALLPIILMLAIRVASLIKRKSVN